MLPATTGDNMHPPKQKQTHTQIMAIYFLSNSNQFRATHHKTFALCTNNTGIFLSPPPQIYAMHTDREEASRNKQNQTKKITPPTNRSHLLNEHFLVDSMCYLNYWYSASHNILIEYEKRQSLSPSFFIVYSVLVGRFAIYMTCTMQSIPQPSRCNC